MEFPDRNMEGHDEGNEKIQNQHFDEAMELNDSSGNPSVATNEDHDDEQNEDLRQMENVNPMDDDREFSNSQGMSSEKKKIPLSSNKTNSDADDDTIRGQ